MKGFKQKWQKLQEHGWFRLLTNRYFILSFSFAVWMIFLDTHSILVHREINAEMNELKRSIDYYTLEIEQDKIFLEQLHSQPGMLEKFAREQYHLKRDGEEIFLVEVQE